MISGNPSLFKRGGRALALNSAISIYDRVMYLVTLVVLSRLLIPSDFGKFALATLISAVCLQLFEFGFGWALINRQDGGRDISTAHAALQIGSTGIGLVLSILVAPLVSRFYGFDVAHFAIALTVGRFVTSFGLTSRHLLEMELSFSRVILVDFMATTISVIAGLAFAWAGWGGWALVLGGTQPALTYALVQSVGYLFLRPIFNPLGRVTLVDVKWFLRYGLPIWLGAQAVPISTQFDAFAVGTFLGSATLGFYDRAFRLAFLPASLLHQFFSRVLLPVYARLQDTPKALTESVSFNFQVGSYAAALACTLFLVVPKETVLLVLGPQWLSSAVLLRVFALFAYARFAHLLAWPLVMALARPGLDTAFNWIVALAAVILVPTAIFLHMDTAGVALAVGVAQTMGALFILTRLRDSGFGVFTAVLSPIPDIFISTGVGMLAGRFFPSPDTLVSLLIKAGSATVVFLIVGWSRTAPAIKHLLGQIHTSTGVTEA